MLDAVRTAPDGEFVFREESATRMFACQNKNGYLLVHVNNSDDKRDKGHQEVQVRVPLAVVDALVASSKGGDDLDVGAALRALATHGDTDLVNIKDGKQTVHVWLDSKNNGD